MDAKELRNRFTDYMSQQGYSKTPADSLVCDTFPTCFTISGGPNFVDRYLKGHQSSSENTVVIQRCHRFWDVEKVGDGKHLSAFEMAVTTSFNGYHREEMHRSHYKFLTEECGLNPDFFTVTIFGGGKCYDAEFKADEEAMRIWKKLGIKRFSIQQGFGISPYHKREVNASFVANTVEPVGGPRTEIYYGDLEIWTSVNYCTSVEYNHDSNSFTFKPIEHHTFASGFGIERVVMAITGYKTIDEVVPSRHAASPRVRDHVRGLVLLAHDGAFELHGRKNSSRKTILNRYVRSLFTSLVDPALLSSLVAESTEFYKDELPTLDGKADEISDKILARAGKLKIKL